jgi:hypothetical protein
MKFNFDRFFSRMDRSRVVSYIFVETCRTDPTRHGKNMFRYTAEFNVKPRGGLVSNYPVVFEDFTTSDGAVLVEVPFDSIPAPIKSKCTKWLKVQSV